MFGAIILSIVLVIGMVGSFIAGWVIREKIHYWTNGTSYDRYSHRPRYDMNGLKYWSGNYNPASPIDTKDQKKQEDKEDADN